MPRAVQAHNRARRRSGSAADGPLRLARIQMDQVAAFVDLVSGAYPLFMTNREMALKGYQEVCKIGHPQLVGAFDGEGRIAGAYALYPFAATIRGRGIPAAGLGMVATALDRKKQKVALRLVRDFAARCRRGRYPLSFLYPFEHDFYAAMGWGLVAEAKQYAFPPQALPLYPERRQVRWVRDVDLQQLDRIHRQYLGRQQALGISRATSRWSWLMRQEQQIFLYGPRTAPEGYLLTRFSQPPGETDRFRYDLEVVEMEWTTPAALRGLLGLLSSQRDQVMRILIDWPTDRDLETVLSEPVAHAAPHLRSFLKPGPVIARGAMLRLEDPAAAFELRPYAGEGALDLVIQTSDPLARNRSLGFQARLRGDAARPASRMRETRSVRAERARLRCNLMTLSRLWAGAIRFRDAVELAQIELEPADAAEALDRLFAVPRPWIVERF